MAIFDTSPLGKNPSPFETLQAALRAAREIRQSLISDPILFLRRDEDGSQKESQAVLNIGICHGTVSSAVFGPRRPKQQSIIGKVVNTASRLETAAENGQILLDMKSFNQHKNELRKTQGFMSCVDWERGQKTIKGEEFEFVIVE
jgi:class 3 adenylate cyclase